MEYNDYKLSIKEKLIVIAKTIAVAVTISYLFFDSFIALVFIPLIFAISCTVVPYADAILLNVSPLFTVYFDSRS